MRKLTSRQLFALDCLDKRLVMTREVPRPVYRHGQRLVVRIYWAIDTDVSKQIKALRDRRFIEFAPYTMRKTHPDRAPFRLTPEGRFELDAARWTPRAGWES